MLKVVECFTSINGEGPRAGELARFIRLKGCNLSCGYCDTAWANTDDCNFVEWTAQTLAEETHAVGLTNVTLTGGEPLLQTDALFLIEALLQRGHKVEIETNGSVSLMPLMHLKKVHPNHLYFTMDYKLPSSGMESSMHLHNLALLTSTDAAKFVSATQEDLERALEIIQTYALDKQTQVYLSPVYGTLDPQTAVNFLIHHNLNAVKLQLQLHKIIWHPDLRGV